MVRRGGEGVRGSGWEGAGVLPRSRLQQGSQPRAHTWSARISLRSPIGRGLPIYRRVDVGWGRDVGSWVIRASVANLFFTRNALGIWPPREPGGDELREDGIAAPLPFLKAEFRW